MASQVSPGVIIRERDISTGVLTGVSALRAGFASSFRSGPVGKITNISSERELISTFGDYHLNEYTNNSERLILWAKKIKV